MGFFGNLIGGGLGHIGGGILGNSDAGRSIGSGIGSFLPFKRGGKVKKMVVKEKKVRRKYQKKAKKAKK